MTTESRERSGQTQSRKARNDAALTGSEDRFRPEDAAELLARLAELAEQLRGLGLDVSVDVSFKVTAREAQP